MKLARIAARKHFEVIEDKGKGSHYRVEFGDKITTIKSGELRPGYISAYQDGSWGSA